MAAVIVDVADAIVTELNENPLTNFGIDFEAERSYVDWSVKLEDLGVLHVEVVPISVTEIEQEMRGGDTTYHVVAQIGVLKRLERNSSTARVPNADVDPLVELLQEINTYLMTATSFTHVDSEIMAAFVPILLAEHGQYTGILQVTYRVTVGAFSPA